MPETPDAPKKPLVKTTPLGIVALFLSFTEAVAGIAATQTQGGAQVTLIAFTAGFPVLVAAAFFAILWFRPYVLYPPAEYESPDVSRFVEAMQKRPETTAGSRITAGQTSQALTEAVPDATASVALPPAEASSSIQPTPDVPPSVEAPTASTAPQAASDALDAAWASYIELVEAGKYREGLEILEAAAAAVADEHRRTLVLGLAYEYGFERGNSEGLERLRRLAAEHPKEIGVRLRLAQALAKVGKANAAVTELQDMTSLAPNEPARATISIELAKILAGNSREREAIDTIRGQLATWT